MAVADCVVGDKPLEVSCEGPDAMVARFVCIVREVGIFRSDIRYCKGIDEGADFTERGLEGKE